MDTLDELSESGSFGMDLAKTFALSAASTAGIIGGLAIAGLVIDAYKKRKKSRNIPVTTEK